MAVLSVSLADTASVVDSATPALAHTAHVADTAGVADAVAKTVAMAAPLVVESDVVWGGTTRAIGAAAQVVEADSVWTPRPTGSYPTAEAAERDLAFAPVVLVDDGEFGEAITDADRTPIFRLMADWNRNGLYDHPLSDLTSLVTDVSIDRSSSGTLPVEVGLVEGYASAALTATLEGEVPSTTVGVVSPARHNLMPNPSVEVNLTGYSLVTTGTLSGLTTQRGTQPPTPPLGQYYLYAQPPNNGTNGTVYHRCPNVAVVAGSTYTFSAYCSVVGTLSSTWMGVDWLDASTNQLNSIGSATGPSFTAGTNWSRTSLTVTIPVGASYARPFLVAGTVSNANYAKWDGVMVELGNELGSYFDGDTAGAFWDGTAGMSTSTFPAVSEAITSAGRPLDVVDVFAPYRPDSPLYGSPMLRTPIYLETGFVATDGPRLQRRFTGTVSQISPASAARSVKISGLDPSTQLRGTLTVPGVGLFANLMAIHGPDVYRERFNSQWVIDQALRANGIYASPPNRDDAILAVTGHGSMIPHIGWGGAPVDYYPTYRGDMWFPGWFGPIAQIDGGTGTWWLTDQVTAAAGDGFGVSMWMAMYPAGTSGDWRLLQMDLTTDASWFFNFGLDAQGRPYVGMLQKGQTEIRATAYTYVPPSSGTWQFVGAHVAFTATSMTVTYRINGATYFGSATLPARAGNWKPGLYLNYSWYGAVTNFQMWQNAVAPVAPWQGEDPHFVSQADLDPGSNQLSAIPELLGVDTWELIKTITDAEGSTFQFTEDGRPQFRSIAGDTYYGRTKTLSEHVTADRNLADLVATTDESTIRNVVNIKTKTQLISNWQDFYVSKDINEFLTPANTVSIFELQLPTAAYEFPPSYSTNGSLDSPGAFRYLGGDAFIWYDQQALWDARHELPDHIPYIRVYLQRTDDPTNAAGFSFVTFQLTRTNPWTLNLQIRNDNAFDVRFATPATTDSTGAIIDGQPAFIIPARIVEEGPEQIETYTDNGSVATYGESSFDVGGSDEKWRQVPDGFRGLATEVLATAAHPVPVLDAVDVPHDPRRKLGDRVSLEDPDGLGSVIGTIVSLNQTYSSQGAMDKVGVRPLAPPGLGLLDDATLGLLDSSLVLGP